MSHGAGVLEGLPNQLRTWPMLVIMKSRVVGVLLVSTPWAPSGKPAKTKLFVDTVPEAAVIR